MRNRFPGKCDRCKKRVEAGNGVTFRLNGQYFVRCDKCQSMIQESELVERATVDRVGDEEIACQEPIQPYEQQGRLDFNRWRGDEDQGLEGPS